MSLPAHLAKKSKEELEKLCTDCGMCCHPAVELDTGDKIVVPDVACKHLARGADGVTKCGVYHTRLDKSVAGNWCRSLEDGIREGIFPKECPYVADIPDYAGPKVFDVALYDIVRPQVQRVLRGYDRPEWAAPDAWRDVVGGTR